MAQEKKTLQAYREATAKRHGILAQSAVHWRAIRALLQQVAKAVAGTLGAAARVDGYMERYQKILRGEDAAERALAASSLKLFVISAFVVAVAGFGGLVNFQLIARPMSELVAGGAWVLGMPVSMIAALVIVLMEVAAGIFVMETLGITQLLPRLSGLPASRRRIVFLVALTGLFLLAAIEASLAILSRAAPRGGQGAHARSFRHRHPRRGNRGCAASLAHPGDRPGGAHARAAGGRKESPVKTAAAGGTLVLPRKHHVGRLF